VGSIIAAVAVGFRGDGEGVALSVGAVVGVRPPAHPPRAATITRNTIQAIRALFIKCISFFSYKHK
jgi:hypothetical protein